MKKKLMFLVPIFTLAALATAGTIIAQQWTDSESAHQWREKTFTVYAALDLMTLAVNPVDPSKSSRGDSLVVDGNLYTNGDGMRGATAGNDPNAPGAIGKIRCRATIIDPSFTVPFASFVTELYSFHDNLTNLLADGLGPNLGFTSHRIVSGGTGRFRGMIGEIEETEIGFNNTGGCNLRVTFKISNASRHHDRAHD